MWWVGTDRNPMRLDCPRCILPADKALLIAAGMDPEVFDTGDPGARFTSITARREWVETINGTVEKT